MKHKIRRLGLTTKVLIGSSLFLASVGMSQVASASGESVFTSVSKSSKTLQQANKTITGTIIDSNGETVIGANVVVKGTTVGTVTDFDGKFTLDVPKGAILQISYIGYNDVEVPVGKQTKLSITLSEDTQALEEVVVVGYGVQKKVNLTGAVSSMDVSKMAESRPINNLSTALAGMAAGVQVSAGSHAPGADGATIQVRGKGTLNTSTPLVIIDGVEGALGSVSPNDVESMSVLKDAASASIYGSRAANGVILITTKKGKEGKMKLSYNGYLSMESPSKMMDPVSDYARYMGLMNEAYTNSNMGAPFSQESIDLWNAHPNEPLLYPNTNAFDVLFGNNTVAQQHAVSLSGASDKISYYTSFTYLDNPGIVENTEYSRYSLRSNVDAKITKWLTIGTNISGYYGSRNINASNKYLENVFGFASQTTPGMVHRHPNGNYGVPHNPSDQGNNVLSRLNDKEGENLYREVRSRFYATLNPVKGLTVTGSYMYHYEDNEQWQKPVFLSTWNFLEDVMVSDGVGRTQVSNTTHRKTRNFMDATARYETSFLDDRLDVAAMVGASQEQWEERKSTSSKFDLLDPALDVIDGAIGDASAGGFRKGWAMRSYFSRLNLGWDDKYLLELNLRSDGSSRFLSDKRWGYFPSGSVAWRLDQEEFMKGIDWLSNLKLRGSYGSLGNNAIDNYDAISVYGKNNYILGSGVNMGLSQGAIANTDLTWESTYVANLGLDFGFFNNQLSGTVDVFNKRTSNILIDLPSPLVHGEAKTPKKNSAEVVNKGIEITLGWQDQVNDFSYYVNGNFTYIKNEVTKFKGEGVRTYDKNRFIEEGYPIKVLYLRPTDGLVQDNNDLKKVQAMLDAEAALAKAENRKPRKVYSSGTPGLGDILYTDANGDGLVNYDDRQVYGEGESSPISLGLSAGVTYKGFDFSFLLQGMLGGQTIYSGHEYRPTARVGMMINEEIADGRWHPGRLDEAGNILDPAQFPKLNYETEKKNTDPSDFWLVSQDYLRVKNLQFGYTFPQTWIDKVGVEKLRVYVSLENYFTITNYPGLDPESGWGYPAMKQASFGINLTF
jgi:TonB-linked SusC/RagA family outer membrane protein